MQRGEGAGEGAGGPPTHAAAVFSLQGINCKERQQQQQQQRPWEVPGGRRVCLEERSWRRPSTALLQF